MKDPYSSQDFADQVIAFSLAYQRENLLRRGMGFEHLRELLLRLARPLLRRGANLAYAGNWLESEDNFTYILLRLISAEQEDGFNWKSATANNEEDKSENKPKRITGKLYNHSPWPQYCDITPKTEAQWINCCRIVRIMPHHAGLEDETLAAARKKGEGMPLYTAVMLSTMRRLMMDEMYLPNPYDQENKERIPPVMARILLGGKVDSYTGFMPGIFEEALVTYQKKRPLYILGGFGGAAEILTKAITEPGRQGLEQLTLAWQMKHNAALRLLLDAASRYTLPATYAFAGDLLEQLLEFVHEAREQPALTLNTGLDDKETKLLMTTRDTATAVKLVQEGLQRQHALSPLPG
ncbi:MAG: hypothetical protein U0Y68_17375 [Blastocatellia bacterium]